MRESVSRALLLWLCGLMPVVAAQVPAVPVPTSPYLPVIYRFADALIEHGRDVYGPEQTKLFLGSMDRQMMTNRPPWTTETIDGYPLGRKQHATASPQHDQNLLRLLYTLSELSGRPKYRDAANDELKWLLNGGASQAVPLLTQHAASWDVVADKVADGRSTVFFKPEASWYRPWMLWEQCFAMDPPASGQIVSALVSKKLQALSKREAGFYIRSCAVAYRITTNVHYLEALETCRAAVTTHEGDLADALALAIDSEGAAHNVPEPAAARLRELARHNDELFCSAQRDAKRAGGFVSRIDDGTAVTTRWGNPWKTTARIGMMCVSRYENTGNIAYRELLHTAADHYFDTDPGKMEDVSPMTLGHVISLHLAAWRSTAQQRYLERARYFGDYALKTFFDAPLPRADAESDRYQSASGTDTLALALVELHLNILGITAVRCPPNTVDR